MREIMLGQPRNHLPMLHVGSSRDVDDEVSQFLPVPFRKEPRQVENLSLRSKLGYLTTSTAPALTFGSLPVTETLAVKEPSMLKTMHSVFGGTTAKKKSTAVWSPLTTICLGKLRKIKLGEKYQITAYFDWI